MVYTITLGISPKVNQIGNCLFKDLQVSGGAKICACFLHQGASFFAAQLPAMQDPWVRRSSGEGNGNPLHILAWRIPTRSLVGCSPLGVAESDMTERLSTYIIYNFMLLYEDNFPPHFIEI